MLFVKIEVTGHKRAARKINGAAIIYRLIIYLKGTLLAIISRAIMAPSTGVFLPVAYTSAPEATLAAMQILVSIMPSDICIFFMELNPHTNIC